MPSAKGQMETMGKQVKYRQTWSSQNGSRWTENKIYDANKVLERSLTELELLEEDRHGLLGSDDHGTVCLDPVAYFLPAFSCLSRINLCGSRVYRLRFLCTSIEPHRPHQCLPPHVRGINRQDVSV